MPRKRDLYETADFLAKIGDLLGDLALYKTREPPEDQELVRRILIEWAKTAEPSSIPLIKGLANSLKKDP